MLNDYQLQQGMRRLIFSGKPHPPTLPEFMKLCRTVGHDDTIPDRPAEQPLPAIGHDDGYDNWAVAANQHLLAYVLRNMGKKRCFNPVETRILVRRKNLWAEQMRLSVTPEGVPIEEQREIWDHCIRLAEEEIANVAKA